MWKFCCNCVLKDLRKSGWLEGERFWAHECRHGNLENNLQSRVEGRIETSLQGSFWSNDISIVHCACASRWCHTRYWFMWWVWSKIDEKSPWFNYWYCTWSQKRKSEACGKRGRTLLRVLVAGVCETRERKIVNLSIERDRHKFMNEFFYWCGLGLLGGSSWVWA